MTKPTSGGVPVAAKILVVEDDALVALGIVTMLEDLGHTVIEANSGTQALAIAERDPTVDLVVTDQSMPGMTGTDLARALKTSRPGLPVILATGYHDVPEGSDLQLPRLSKPYDDAAVAKLIAEILARGPT
ncbi:response regulator [Aureimonas leprariae]|uniref:Response regulator n=1 Tax=Plantimonas leprariae TaxID=2615207 RepID=A0A7V7PSH4_9HYPH|nr:response regulator [Aureimonas leprariae]KAB0681998.1 response regulator [Aureimonas leprariae]